MKSLRSILDLKAYDVSTMDYPNGVGKLVRISRKTEIKKHYVQYGSISKDDFVIDDDVMFELYLDSGNFSGYFGAFHDIKDAFKMIDYFEGGRFSLFHKKVLYC